MKASMHSGRSGNAKHNDRTFLQGKSEQARAEIAPHIDTARTGANRIWVTGMKGWHKPGTVTIADAERTFYKNRYGASQEAKNRRYEAQRHPERRKSTDDLYTGKQTRPEEVILQVGSQKEPVSEELFRACLSDYIGELSKWNKEHGGHMKWLSIAIHVDETSPHAHIRRVWEHNGKDGPTLGQDKALQEAGVPLPDPDKPKGRYNNRKISFDRMMREKWLDICESHGIEVDREPVPNMRHKSKADFIRDQIAQDIHEAEATRDDYWAQVDSARKEMFRAQDEHAEAVEALRTARAQLEDLRLDIESAESKMDALKASVEMLTAAESAKIPERVRGPLQWLVGRNNAVVSLDTLNKLAKTAALAEKAAEETVALSAERRRIEREAQKEAKRLRDRERERGEREAKSLVDRAREQAGTYIELRQEVDRYHRLEDRYPEHFEAMERAEAERHRHKHTHTRERD